jgi:hypothetical protein
MGLEGTVNRGALVVRKAKSCVLVGRKGKAVPWLEGKERAVPWLQGMERALSVWTKGKSCSLVERK